MTHIVERLRYWQSHDSVPLQNTMKEAADEIERLTSDLKAAIWSDSEECKMLTAENARLRAALDDCVAFMDGDIFGPDQRRGILAAARRALEPKPLQYPQQRYSTKSRMNEPKP